MATTTKVKPQSRSRTASVSNKRPSVLAKAMDMLDLDTTDLAGNPIQRIPHHRVSSPDDIEKHYKTLEAIGEGAFGKVKLVRSVTGGTVWAEKIIKKKVGDTELMKQIDREILILKKARHSNIINVAEVFETTEKVYMIVELYEAFGGMYTSEKDVKRISWQIIDAVAYLHDYGVVHRDLKPENILLVKGAFPSIRIVDFGLVTFHDACNTIDSTAGTPFYMAPEVFDGNGYSQQCDIWSIGVIIYLLAVKYNENVRDMLESMISCKRIEYPNHLWQNASSEAQNMVSCCLKWNPAERSTAKELKKHGWFASETYGSHDGSSNTFLPTVINMMRSYNAERRLKKTFWMATAMCKWMLIAKVDIRHEKPTGDTVPPLTQVRSRRRSSVTDPNSRPRSNTANGGRLPTSHATVGFNIIENTKPRGRSNTVSGTPVSPAPPMVDRSKSAHASKKSMDKII